MEREQLAGAVGSGRWTSVRGCREYAGRPWKRTIGSCKLTTGGMIALVASLVVTLGAAILSGKVGERFHKTIDRV